MLLVRFVRMLPQFFLLLLELKYNDLCSLIHC